MRTLSLFYSALLTRVLQSEGWPDGVIAPSSEAYSVQTIVPKEATKEDIDKFKADWVAAVRRALKAGVDVSSDFTTLKYQCALDAALILISPVCFPDHRGARGARLPAERIPIPIGEQAHR